MGFGLNAKIEVPKVEVPKVEVPKVPAAPAVPKAPDLAGAVSGAAAGIQGAVSGAVAGVAATAKAAAGGVLDAVGKVGASLAGVAGALAEVNVSFKGGTEDIAMEPHLVLDANASYEETKFEKGPVWIRVDMTPEKAKANTETLRLFTAGGEYDKQGKIRDFKEEHGKWVDVLFEEAPMNMAFSLEAIPESGSAHVIFSHVPYGDLRKTKNRL